MARRDRGRMEIAARPDDARPRWLRLGVAALLGAVAGATLFAAEAQGRPEKRRTPDDGRP